MNTRSRLHLIFLFACGLSSLPALAEDPKDSAIGFADTGLDKTETQPDSGQATPPNDAARIATAVAQETHVPALVTEVKPDGSLKVIGPAGLAMPHESWKGFDMRLGANFGTRTMIGVGISVDILKYLVGLHVDGGPSQVSRFDGEGMGWGPTLRFRPLALKGFKYVFLNGRYYQVHGHQPAEPKPTDARNSRMLGAGFGVQAPIAGAPGKRVGIAIFEAGRGRFSTQRFDGSVTRETGWYFNIGLEYDHQKRD